MPEEAASNGAAEQPSGTGAADVEGWMEAGNSVAETWYAEEGTRRQDIADDPCRFVIDAITFNDDPGGPAFTYRNLAAAATKLYEAGNRAIEASLDSWGKPTSAHARGMKFTTWMMDTGTVPTSSFVAAALLLPPPIGPALAAAGVDSFLNDRLPQSQPPSNQARGHQIASGVYLWAGPNGDHVGQGRLTGPAVRAAYNQWVAHQENTVAPPGFAGWRDRLNAVAGPNWTPGAPPMTGTRLFELNILREDLEAMIDEAEAACAANRDFSQRLAADQVAGATAIGMTEAETPVRVAIIAGVTVVIAVAARMLGR